MTAGSVDHIMPKDVTIEILLRLPVKSLLRFKCVCKSWCTLIRKSSFITNHLCHRHNNARLLVQHYNDNTEKYAFALFSNETLASVPPIFQDLDDLQFPSYSPNVVGPLNGIVCLWDCDRVALWNPAMREFRPLHIPHPNFPPYFMCFSYFFGFGLDLVTNDYKVVWIRHYWDEKDDDPYIPRVISVYSLVTDSWRIFEVDSLWSGAMHNSLCNTYINGAYHWQIKDIKVDWRKYSILSFDMHYEVFQETPTPPDFSKLDWGDLAVYNDSIAMFLYDVHVVEKYFDMWVMKEKGHWAKHLTIGPLPNFDGPLGFWKNGEILLETSTSRLVLYNPNTQEIRDLGPRGKGHCLKALTYNESLVSIRKENECPEGFKSFNMVRIQEYYTFA